MPAGNFKMLGVGLSWMNAYLRGLKMKCILEMFLVAPTPGCRVVC